MHHIIQKSGTPDEIRASMADDPVSADPYELELLSAATQLVNVVLAGCSGKVSVSVLLNAHANEHHSVASEDEKIKHSLHALGDGKAQSLSLVVKATLI